MGHRRFGNTEKRTEAKEEDKSKQCVQQKHEYIRTPNPNARNYLDEMAPVNGLRELKEEEYDAVQRQRDAFRDMVSKRMGELLLRGVTMLDAYCQTCSGILMEDREQVRSCVTCDLFKEQQEKAAAKKSPVAAKIVAEIPLDCNDTADITTHAVQNAATEAVSATTSTKAERAHNERGATEETELATKKMKRVESASNLLVLPGLSSALSTVDAKMAWAAKELENEQHTQRIRDLLIIIKEGAETLRVLTGQ